MHETHHHSPSSSSLTKGNGAPLCLVCCWVFAPHAPFVSLSLVVVFSSCRTQQQHCWVSRARPPAQKSPFVFNELCACGSQPEAFHSWPVGISFSPLTSASCLPLFFSLLIILSFRLIRAGVVWYSVCRWISPSYIKQSLYLPINLYYGMIAMVK